MRRITQQSRIRGGFGRAAITGAAACVLLAAAASEAAAQGARRPERRVRPELRIDYLAAPDGIQAGAGAVIRVSTYVRLAAIGGFGPHFDDDIERFGWRTDLLGRFQLDPFRERRWAPYSAAGVSVRGAGSDTEQYLVALFGLEGPLVRGWSPALEAGVGGGFRAGLVMRRSGPRSR